MISFQNVLDGQGFALTFAGMVIVFAALIILSVFMNLLPKILCRLQQQFPILFEEEGAQRTSRPDEAELSQLCVAAIAYALHRQAAVKR